ncbi:hypothetical protein AAMO2058_000760600 [Amorphochlora amoebiformis]
MGHNAWEQQPDCAVLHRIENIPSSRLAMVQAHVVQCARPFTNTRFYAYAYYQTMLWSQVGV